MGSTRLRLLTLGVALLAAMLFVSCTARRHSVDHFAGRGVRQPFVSPVLYQIPRLRTDVPPSQTHSPIVAAAYKRFDSLLRLTDYDKTKHFFERLTPGDTARQLARLYYLMDDEDPLAFFQWMNWSVPFQHYGCPVSKALTDYEHQMSRLYPDSARITFLLTSDVIAEVTVRETAMYVHPTVISSMRFVAVDCIVNEPIKGRMLPYYEPNNPLRHEVSGSAFDEAEPRVVAEPGACFRFQYTLDISAKANKYSGEDLPYIKDSLIDPVTHRPWIEVDSQYIVFLRVMGDRPPRSVSTTDSVFFTLLPNVGFGTSAVMYPVRGGKVIDPNNDFGFGTNLTASEWKARLRKKTETITH